MSAPDRTRDEIPVAAGATPSATPVAGEPFANWSDRMQRARGRHAAITRNLYTWSSYKTWAERAKTNWEGGDDK